jgi:hypothetical protein
MPRARERRRPTREATASSSTGKQWPIATGAAANGMAGNRGQSARSLRTSLVSMTWWVTYSSGPRIAATPITTARRRIAQRGPQATFATTVSFAAVPGSAPPTGSAPRPAAGTPRALETTSMASGSPVPFLHLEIFVSASPVSFGVWREAPNILSRMPRLTMPSAPARWSKPIKRARGNHTVLLRMLTPAFGPFRRSRRCNIMSEIER